MEIAKIHAGTAIQQHSQYKNYLSLASRLDGVVSKLQMAEQQAKLTPQLAKAANIMAKSFTDTDMVKMTSTMDKFEVQMENLDVRAGVMDSALAGGTQSMTNQDDVDMLMQQVADEHGLEIASQMDAAGMVGSGKVDVADAEVEASEDRLRALRAGVEREAVAAGP